MARSFLFLKFPLLASARAASGICEYLFSRSMQEFFSLSDIFFDASLELFRQKKESFSTALLKNFNSSAKTGGYPLPASFALDFYGKNLKKQEVSFCIIIRQNPSTPYFLDLFHGGGGVFRKVIHRGCGHAGSIFRQGA